MRPNLGCFKMHEMAGKPEDYRTIEEHNIIVAVSCVVHTKELVKVVRSISWPTYITDIKDLENSYYFAFQAIIHVLAQHQRIGYKRAGCFERAALQNGETSAVCLE
jgi:hypothetical protein